MNTAPLKTFAIQSRNILKQGVLKRINALDFDSNGNVIVEEPKYLEGKERVLNGRVLKEGGGALFLNKVIDDKDFYEGWIQLRDKIKLHGIKQVCEEAAYTWFNRLVAIRIMSKKPLYRTSDGICGCTNQKRYETQTFHGTQISIRSLRCSSKRFC